MILVSSFAYNDGLSEEFLGAVIDARIMDNPRPSPRLLRQNGLSKEYQAILFKNPHNKEVLSEALHFARQQVKNNGEDNIAVGCQLGMYRSVALAEKIAKSLKKDGHRVSIAHSVLEVYRRV